MTAMQQPEQSAVEGAASELPTNSKIQPRPLGPDSLTWKDFGSKIYQIILQQAFILQSAHPVINAAVTKDKKYKYDPWGRARNSIKLLWPIVYSRPEKAIEMGKQLRELHRQIKGVDKDGKKYHALDPEAYSWVHITGFDANVRLHEIFGKPLTPEQRKQAFEEWKQMGAMLGIIDKYIPQTEEEYWKLFNQMIEERLQWGEALDDLMDPWNIAKWPKPPEARWMPTFIWKAIAIPTSWMVHKITVATLPLNFRARFQIRYNSWDQFVFRSFVVMVKMLYPLVPESMRYIPLAKRAIDDARQHPEAYRYVPPEPAAELAGA